VQSSSQIVTTDYQHPTFLQPGCPSCRPTDSVKALKGKIAHSMDLLTPSSRGVFQLSLTTDSSWLPWGRVDMPLISPLMPVPHSVTSSQSTIHSQTQQNNINYFTQTSVSAARRLMPVYRAVCCAVLSYLPRPVLPTLAG